MTDLRAMSEGALTALVAELGEPKYRAQQLFRWLHQRGARSFEEMSDLSKGLREKLAAKYAVTSLSVAKVEKSRDGTRKYAFRTHKGDIIESVFIPDSSSPGRNTLCISSQVGCAVDCKFCLTASLGLIRNLNAGEIAEQIARVREDLEEERSKQSAQRAERAEAGARATPERAPLIGNVVMMGMGEPLQNYTAVVESLRIMISELGHGMSPRRITVSTAGLAPRIPRLGRDVPVNLAVSLNATTDAVRDKIMPINKRWNIEALLSACKQFPLPKRRRITFEYVLLAGVNDTDDDARRLVKLLRPMRSKVNLIPFNEHPYSPFSRPSDERIARFQELVAEGDLTAMVRTPRGDDISAACGQLGVEVEAPHSRLHVVA